MSKLANRARVASSTTGTGPITLGDSLPGFQTFAEAGVLDGDVVSYAIEDGTAWEIGTGTYTASGTTLSRTVSESSNADAALSLSGDAVVFVTALAADIVTPAFTGDVTITGELKADSLNEGFASVTSTTNATTIDCEAANVFLHTLTENTTFIFSNPPATGTAYGFTLKLVQDSTARTVTWPASVKWAAATAPTISTGSGEVDVFTFFSHDGGTNWYGFTAGQVLS